MNPITPNIENKSIHSRLQELINNYHHLSVNEVGYDEENESEFGEDNIESDYVEGVWYIPVPVLIVNQIFPEYKGIKELQEIVYFLKEKSYMPEDFCIMLAGSEVTDVEWFIDEEEDQYKIGLTYYCILQTHSNSEPDYDWWDE